MNPWRRQRYELRLVMTTVDSLLASLSMSSNAFRAWRASLHTSAFIISCTHVAHGVQLYLFMPKVNYLIKA